MKVEVMLAKNKGPTATKKVEVSLLVRKQEESKPTNRPKRVVKIPVKVSNGSKEFADLDRQINLISDYFGDQTEWLPDELFDNIEDYETPEMEFYSGPEESESCEALVESGDEPADQPADELELLAMIEKGQEDTDNQNYTEYDTGLSESDIDTFGMMDDDIDELLDIIGDDKEYRHERELLEMAREERLAAIQREVMDQIFLDGVGDMDAQEEPADIDIPNHETRYFSRDEHGARFEVAEGCAIGHEKIIRDAESGKLSRICGVIKNNAGIADKQADVCISAEDYLLSMSDSDGQ